MLEYLPRQPFPLVRAEVWAIVRARWTDLVSRLPCSSRGWREREVARSGSLRARSRVKRSNAEKTSAAADNGAEADNQSKAENGDEVRDADKAKKGIESALSKKVRQHKETDKQMKMDATHDKANDMLWKVLMSCEVWLEEIRSGERP